MVPQIENLTHKLDIGNSKKEINILDIFSGNQIKCDLCEYTASKITVLKSLLTIKHKNKCAVFWNIYDILCELCDIVCTYQTAIKEHSKTLDLDNYMISEPS